MQAVLRVVGGKNDGKQIRITVPEFFIGRGEQAHLRPSSDLVSRMHCAIRLKDGKVEIEDLGSRNGSFVNDEQLTGVHQASSGDRLRIGKLNFEVLIDPTLAGNKKPKVKDVADAAARTAEKPKQEQKDEEQFANSINDWLSEPDDRPLDGSIGNSETVQFSAEDIEALLGGETDVLNRSKKNDEKSEDDSASVESSADDSEEDESGDEKKKKKKKEYGKLPPRPKFSHDNSTSAAGDVLKKFFNRR